MPLFALPTNALGLIVILAVILLLFGNRLPLLMRSLGRSVTEFKKGVNDPGEIEDDGDNTKKQA
ncbi:MAG: twin-arginine translocase TatA/TatE family subunit [Planctomycetes bacterium]|nr:twin-arginine translocase TatA/TatE family subunit [Planctomycetota bacterium]